MVFLMRENVKKEKPVSCAFGFIMLALPLIATAPAQAYIGPGAALGLVGYAVSLGAMVVISLLTVLAWPVMVMLKKRKQSAAPAAEVAPVSETLPAELPAKDR